MPLLRFLRVARQRARAIIRGRVLDGELDRELAFHLEQLTAEYVAAGMPHGEARHAARRDLGNVPLLADQCRDQRRVGWLHDLRQDLAYGARMFARHPRVACVIVTSLALGIGANTAVLGVMASIFGTRLPIPESDRVVVAHTVHQDTAWQKANVTLREYFAWRDQNRSFAALGLGLGNQANFADAAGAPAERIAGVAVTAEMFSVLRVPTVLGRVFTEDEARRSQSAPPLVLSHRLWQRRFGGAPDIIGKPVRMNAVTAHVVGVMPPGFHYPSDVVDYWVPLVPNPLDAQTAQRLFVVAARLEPDITREQAQSDLNRIAAQLAREYPQRQGGWSVRVTPVREAMFGWTRQPLMTLEAAVALVLLVAGINVAGLLLARAFERSPEMAVRSALGAARGRLIRQLLTETTLFAVVGGVLGLAVAWLGVRALMTLSPPPGSVGVAEVRFDARMVGVAAMLSMATGLLFGVIPAMAGSKWKIAESRSGRLREALVAAQIAITFVLLIGAGLLTKSFVFIITRAVNFDPARLLTFQVNIPIGEFMQRRGTADGRPYFEITPPPALTFQRTHDGLRAIPGATAVAGISAPLVNSLVVPSMEVRAGTSGKNAVALTGGGGANEPTVDTAYFFVTPEFFTAVGARLRGRDFTPADTAVSQWVAIVNETAARMFWPGEDAIGKQVMLARVPEERPREVIGVIADIPLALPEPDPRPVVYTSYLQQPGRYPLPGANLLGQMVFLLRSAGDPLSLLPAARQVVKEIDPNRPLANIMTMEQQLRMRVPRRADYLLVIGAFACAAMLLAAIGIYGIVAYATARRTREIGIRLALGATRANVVRLVGRRAVMLVLVGLGAGVGGAVALTRLLRTQLVGVTPTDPITFFGALLVVTAVSAVACALPTRKATRINPTVALRCE